MKIVLTGGKYNKIHPGHIWLLKKAKKLGYLVVVLAHDSRNNREYALSSKIRKKNLEDLEIADKVIIGYRDDFVKVVKKFKPNIIVLGYDQKLPDDKTKRAAKEMKIKLIKLKKHGNYETRKLGTLNAL